MTAANPRRRILRELVHIHASEDMPHDAAVSGEEQAWADATPVAQRFGLSVRRIAAHHLVPMTGAMPRLMMGSQDLLAEARCFTVSRACAHPATARFMQAIYETILDSDSLLLNDSIVASDALERDKMAMACHAAKLGIPVVPMLALPFGPYAQGVMAHVAKLGEGPWMLKPRELSSSQAVLKADTLQQLRAAIDIAAQGGGAYIVQPDLLNDGHLQVLMVDASVRGCTLLRPAQGLASEALGQGEDLQTIDPPEQIKLLCHRLCDSLKARHLSIDWLLTPKGPMLTEWSTALSASRSPVRIEAFFDWIATEIAAAETGSLR
jgi:hypothetical protein